MAAEKNVQRAQGEALDSSTNTPIESNATSVVPSRQSVGARAPRNSLALPPDSSTNASDTTLNSVVNDGVAQEESYWIPEGVDKHKFLQERRKAKPIGFDSEGQPIYGHYRWANAQVYPEETSEDERTIPEDLLNSAELLLRATKQVKRKNEAKKKEAEAKGEVYVPEKEDDEWHWTKNGNFGSEIAYYKERQEKKRQERIRQERIRQEKIRQDKR